jgi:hypothetical protein
MPRREPLRFSRGAVSEFSHGRKPVESSLFCATSPGAKRKRESAQPEKWP